MAVDAFKPDGHNECLQQVLYVYVLQNKIILYEREKERDVLQNKIILYKRERECLSELPS